MHHAEGIAKRQAGSSVFVQPKRRGRGHDRQLMRDMRAQHAGSVAPGSPSDCGFDSQAMWRGFERPLLAASRVVRTRLASTLLTAVSWKVGRHVDDTSPVFARPARSNGGYLGARSSAWATLQVGGWGCCRPRHNLPHARRGVWSAQGQVLRAFPTWWQGRVPQPMGRARSP